MTIDMDGSVMKHSIESFPGSNNKGRMLVDTIWHHYWLLILFLVLTLIIGFETAFALGLISRIVGGMLNGGSFIFLCFYYIYRQRGNSAVSKPCVLDTASLLNRDIVPLETAEAHDILRGHVVLVTGAAGSIGSELCCQLLGYSPKRVIALDNNETGLFDLTQALRFHKHASCFHPYIGDITDVRSMERFFATEQPEVVFHAAAYKHVPLLEQHPEQAIRTNAIATYHLCRLAQEHAVKRFVFVSTDKAAEPTSILGASKRIGEMIVQSLAQSVNSATRFCAVRFGNVIGSRGSVVPVFTQQIQQGGPVTVTDPEATRYFMTIPEACGLVILTATMADQGELYLLDMGDPIRIVDVAIKMIRAYGLRIGHDISIVYTGLRPGEKLHETLVAADEKLHATAHTKILGIASSHTPSTVQTMSQWISTLENSLLSESGSQLRERLFEFVHKQELMMAK